MLTSGTTVPGIIWGLLMNSVPRFVLRYLLAPKQAWTNIISGIVRNWSVDSVPDSNSEIKRYISRWSKR